MNTLLAISWPTILSIAVWTVGIGLVLFFGYKFLLRALRHPEKINEEGRFVKLEALERYPFSGQVVFQFTLPFAAHVVFEVLNESYEVMEELVNETRLPGKYHMPYSIQHLPNGVYRYRLVSDNRQMEKTFNVHHQKGRPMEVAYETL